MTTRPCFIIRPSFAKLIHTFEEKYFRSFPEYPCSYCGVLSPLRKTLWTEFDQNDFNNGCYGLTTRLGFRLCRNAEQKIAMCSICKVHRRDASDVGSWSRALLDVAPCSRMFLSFVKLNCNLGRTQSHSGTDWHNKYSTYRTLSGI